MLEIVQAKDFKNYYKKFEELNISDEIVSVVEALNNSDIIGYGIYHYNDEKVIIDYVDGNNDRNLYDGIVRAILYLAMMNNIDNAMFNFDDREMLKKLGFVNDNNNHLESITKFMDKCKNCRKA